MPSALIYARVSSKDQEREGFSIPAQLDLLRRYALDRDLHVLNEFVDVETAKQAGRSSFGEMVSFIKEHRGRLIVLVEKTIASIETSATGSPSTNSASRPSQRRTVMCSRSCGRTEITHIRCRLMASCTI
jgi:hypothetical protein